MAEPTHRFKTKPVTIVPVGGPLGYRSELTRSKDVPFFLHFRESEVRSHGGAIPSPHHPCRKREIRMSMLQNHQVDILVVDPDAESRVEINEILMEDGYSCRAVGSAAEALQAANNRLPNLLICEVNLRDGSGFDVFASISKLGDCPAVFMSDSRRSETMRLARQAGATYFLSKPFDPTVLMELVDKSLWMPHLVRRHVDSAAHKIKAPTFSPTPTRQPLVGN